MPTIQQLVRKGREIIKAKVNQELWIAARNVVAFVQGFTQLLLKNRIRLLEKLPKFV